MKLVQAGFLIAAALPAFGQTPAPIPAGRCWQDPTDGYGKLLQRIEKATDDAGLAAAVSELVDVGLNVHCFAEFAGRRDAVKSLMRAIDNARTDKQSGASATGAGTTLVSRGAAAKVLGFAAESGALMQTTKGQLVTFSGNLGGIPSALIRKDIFPYCDPRSGDLKGSCVSQTALRALRRVSFSLSFDASRDAQTVTGTPVTPAATGTTATNPIQVTFDGARNELSSVSARVELVNHRDVTSKEYQKSWLDKIKTEATLNSSGKALLAALEATGNDLLRTSEYQAWFKNANARMISAQRKKENLGQVWADMLADLVVTFRSTSKEFQDNVNQLRSTFQVFDFDEDTFIDTLGTKPLLTFEYLNNRPVGQTPVSTFRLIGEAGWAKKNNFTFNLAIAVFDSAQPPMPGVSTSRIRDFEAGMQYERKLGQLSIFGAGALDASFYIQNQRSDSILTVDPANPIPGVTFVGLPSGANAVFAKKGNIKIGQVRLVLGPEKSNVRIPVAVSYSNRIDLVDKPTWRAQIGISYDFDALFTK